MSGTNRLINSVITGRKGSNSALTKALDNANEVGKQQDIKGGKKSKKK